MISNWLSAALARRNIHYGWVMVGVTFLAALISAGTVGAPGVFIVPLQKEFGWSNAEISSALSIRFILFGLMAPFAAALLNRYGLRNVTLAAQLVVVSGLVGSLFMTKVWQPTAAGFREGDEAGVRAAVDGFGELGYSATDQKMTFDSLPALLRCIPDPPARCRAPTAWPISV